MPANSTTGRFESVAILGTQVREKYAAAVRHARYEVSYAIQQGTGATLSPVELDEFLRVGILPVRCRVRLP